MYISNCFRKVGYKVGYHGKYKKKNDFLKNIDFTGLKVYNN